MAFEENNTLDQTIGVMHFFNRFSTLLGSELLIAPVVEETEMDPILVDCTQFEKERFVKPLDYLCFAFHDDLRSFAA